MTFFEVICLSVAGVDLGSKLRQRGCSIYVYVAISQILVIPDVIVVVAFLVCCILLRLVDLATGRPLHPLVHLKVLEVVQLLDLAL